MAPPSNGPPGPRWPRYDRAAPDSVWRAIEDIRDAVDAMTTADEIAAEVAKRVRKERTLVLSGFQRLAALLVAGAAVTTAVHSWVG